MSGYCLGVPSNDSPGERPDAGDGRNETPTERLDRNWTDLLQELRVLQTGVQLLTGVLLTVPFQQRFSEVSSAQRDMYLATVSSAIGAAVMFQAPVSLHRLLFRLHERRETVMLAHRMTLAGIVLLCLALSGASVLVFDIVEGGVAAAIAGSIVAIALITFWAAIPLLRREKVTRR